MSKACQNSQRRTDGWWACHDRHVTMTNHSLATTARVQLALHNNCVTTLETKIGISQKTDRAWCVVCVNTVILCRLAECSPTHTLITFEKNKRNLLLTSCDKQPSSSFTLMLLFTQEKWYEGRVVLSERDDSHSRSLTGKSPPAGIINESIDALITRIDTN